MGDFERELARRRNLIELALQRYVPDASGNDTPLAAGMRYALCGGGKRIRPVLALEGFYLATEAAAVEPVMPAACALEMIHGYSLVHDDLPAMDDDQWRRGKPACHVVYGEAGAILIGDALLTQAFAVLAEAAGEAADPRLWARVTAEVAQAAGAEGMVLGQIMDLTAQDHAIAPSQLEKLHQYKTGRLLTASLRAGAILGGMPAEPLAQLTDFAQHLGILFQITDDILDRTGDPSLLGKDVGRDAARHKATYVSLYGLEGAQEKASLRLESALASLEPIDADTSFLKSMTKYIVARSQ